MHSCHTKCFLVIFISELFTILSRYYILLPFSFKYTLHKTRYVVFNRSWGMLAFLKKLNNIYVIIHDEVVLLIVFIFTIKIRVIFRTLKQCF